MNESYYPYLLVAEVETIICLAIVILMCHPDPCLYRSSTGCQATCQQCRGQEAVVLVSLAHHTCEVTALRQSAEMASLGIARQ